MTSSDVIASLRRALDQLGHEDLIAGPGAANAVTDLLILRSRFDAELARRVVMVHHSGEFAADGHSTTASWLRDAADCAHNEARRFVSMARQADAMPRMNAGWRDGSINTTKVELLAKIRGRDNTSATLFGPLEDSVADVCVAGRLHDLRAWANRFVELAERQRTMEYDEIRPSDGHDSDGSNRVHASKSFHGALIIDGAFDAEHGSIVDRALHVETQRMRREGDRLNFSQRRGLALASICSQYLAQQFKAGNSEAQVVIHIDARMAENTHLGLGETNAGLLAPIGIVQTLLCDSPTSQLYLNQDGVVLDHGRAKRQFSNAQKRAIRAMYPHCVWAHCDVIATDCQTHHVEHWESGGTTDLANGLPLCWRHHRYLHDHPGYQITKHEQAGRWQITRPDGTILNEIQPRRLQSTIPLQPSQHKPQAA